jgi:tRNA pseudouridine55 synthase
MDGFLLLDKEKGISSNQLVQHVKKTLSLKKVGHLGTLDPMATGLMILAINRATKFSNYFLESDKSYNATVQLGSSTDTDDAMGTIVSSSDTLPTQKDIHESLKSFIGKSMQIAPYFSALKHKGKPLYKYAREGKFVSKPPREVNIFSIKNIMCEHNKCSFIIHCSKGTYIRSIARDLGEKLNSGGHLSTLRRLSQGSFNIENAMTMENVELNNLIAIEEAFSELSEIKFTILQKNFLV